MDVIRDGLKRELLRAGFEIRQYEPHQGKLAGMWYWRIENEGEVRPDFVYSNPFETPEGAMLDALREVVDVFLRDSE